MVTPLPHPVYVIDCLYITLYWFQILTLTGLNASIHIQIMTVMLTDHLSECPRNTSHALKKIYHQKDP